jgi:hypothetical protein
VQVPQGVPRPAPPLLQPPRPMPQPPSPAPQPPPPPPPLIRLGVRPLFGVTPEPQLPPGTLGI